MNKILLKLFVEKKGLALTFFVLFSQFISETVLADKKWTEDYVNVVWIPEKNCIDISILVYDYLFTPGANIESQRHGYLRRCKFEASYNNSKYFELTDINCDEQNKTNNTYMILNNNTNAARIELRNVVNTSSHTKFWSENKPIRVSVSNFQEKAILRFRWHLDGLHTKVRYLRISGKWNTMGGYASQIFKNIIYDITKPDQPIVKSKTPYIKNTKVFNDDTPKVFKESKAIVIKGAKLGANIKVYDASGVEIKSVISNNDVVKINLPAKQIYTIQTGISRYKVAL